MKTILAAAAADIFLVWGAIGGEVRIHGGMFRLEGEVRADRVILQTNATLFGNGILRGDLLARGLVMPGTAVPLNVGTQRVAGNVTFETPGRFACDAVSHTALDRLEATGAVSGVCIVVITNAPGAIPLGQLIVLGNAASDYAAFSPSNTYLWRLSETGSVDLALTDLRGDSDGDSLPDWWETAYWSNRLDGAAAADSDGDGMDNLGEYIANTLPQDADSLLEFTRIAAISTNVQVTWTTADGRRYALVGFTNLETSAGVTAAVFTVYGQPEHSWTDTVNGAGGRYYSVKVEENAP